MQVQNPFITHYRNVGDKDTAVFFIHGFTGDGIDTWDGFIPRITDDPALSNHIFFFWDYPSDLKLSELVMKYFWEGTPGIVTLGQGLRTLLDNCTDEYLDNYKKLILIGHSMGGLVIQAFIIEELLNGRRKHLDRLTEVLLYGTPSAGLEKAYWGRFFKEQLADMSDMGDFIKELRRRWKELIDDKRADQDRAACFRLTLVAGMKDKFVPQESSLNPFPFDEKEIGPGNHTQMVKPAEVGALPYSILRKRLLRPALTSEERRLIVGESEKSLSVISAIQAAARIGDVELLRKQGEELLGAKSSLMPLADRALGLALLDHAQYDLSAALLKRYLNFTMPDSAERPFQTDAQAKQQLAIALSGADDIAGAVALLDSLDPQVKNDPETKGILAGRFKRQWRKSRKIPIGYRAYRIYREGLDIARDDKNWNQVFYNGINAAFMSFAMGESDYAKYANEVLEAYARLDKDEDLEDSAYWAEASRAEAYLLLRRYDEAAEAYRYAITKEPEPRYWGTTSEQAHFILELQGNPPEASRLIDALNRITAGY